MKYLVSRILYRNVNFLNRISNLFYTRFQIQDSRYRVNPLRGFTLVESMVAISILSLAVTGPLLIAQKGVGSAIYARDQITAFYLAQEAVEYIRNVRDSNRIEEVPWLSSLGECSVVSGTERCHIDAQHSDFKTVDAITSCTGAVSNPCGKLAFYKNGVDAYYGYGIGPNWTPTQYTREIFIDNRAVSNEALISVTIKWNTSLFTPERVFTVEEYIFDF